MAASSFPSLAGTLAVDGGTGTPTPGSAPIYDANGNVNNNAVRSASGYLTATGTAAGSLSGAFGNYFFNGTAAATYTLPAESNSAGLNFRIVNGVTNVLTLAPFGAELINGATNTITVATNFTGSRHAFTDPSTNAGFIVI